LFSVAVLGVYLQQHWSEQSRYDNTTKPYTSFNILLDGDPYLESVIPTPEEQAQRMAPTLKLRMSKMLEVGGMGSCGG
jgi:hypothetical protein